MAAYQVRVDPLLVGLIPEFVGNRRRDLASLDTWVREGRFEEIRKLAHTLRGVCAPYGFQRIGELALDLDASAVSRDRDGVLAALRGIQGILDDYVVLVEEDPNLP